MFDLEAIVSRCFPSVELRSLDHVILHSECVVRNVFTLKAAPLGAPSERYTGAGSLCTPAPQARLKRAFCYASNDCLNCFSACTSYHCIIPQ